MLQNTAIRKWLPWQRQSWWSRGTGVKMLPEQFQEKSLSMVVVALIVLKLQIFSEPFTYHHHPQPSYQHLPLLTLQSTIHTVIRHAT